MVGKELLKFYYRGLFVALLFIRNLFPSLKRLCENCLLIRYHSLPLFCLIRVNSKASNLDRHKMVYANYIILWPGPKEKQKAHLNEVNKQIVLFLSVLFYFHHRHFSSEFTTDIIQANNSPERLVHKYGY